MGTTKARQANKLDEFGMKINSRNLTFKQNDPYDFVQTNWGEVNIVYNKNTHNFGSQTNLKY